MKVLDISEHENGSATYTFDMTEEEHIAMCKNGILWAITAGITGVSMEQTMRDWMNEEQNKEDVFETVKGSMQEEMG